MIIDQALQLQFDKKPDGTFVGLDGMQPEPSTYKATPEEQAVINMVIDSFRVGDLNLRTPRRELNDMSILARDAYDRMSFNIYQPNNGQGYDGAQFGNWQSNAMRPVVRNKVISVAAHVTARMLFPKVFAYNDQSEEQEEAATVMKDLMEWAGEQCDYPRFTMYGVINALVSPLSIMHVEYAESFTNVKTEKVEGKWKIERKLDEESSGFILTPVPLTEFYFGNVYIENIQRQPFLIWRRPQNYSTMRAKYGHLKNFEHVKPGMQTIYNDANIGFYNVYDPNLRGDLCEEIIFWSRALDLRLVMVNGVLLTDHDQPNPRLDKRYPFATYGYEQFDEGNMLIKKSLAFKMQPDADIINTLYPMIIDGTYLNIMPPMIVTGEEAIGADVVVPGVTTTLPNPDATVTPLRVAQDIRGGIDALMKVEESINQSSEQPLDAPNTNDQTAYGMSVLRQQQQTMLGPFVRMIGSYVKQVGELLKSDILQYITLAEADQIIDNPELIYKTIIVHDRQSDGKPRSRRIKFDSGMESDLTEEDHLDASYNLLEEQGGEDTGEEIYKVNPALFRKLKFMTAVSPDVINPMSEEMERAMGLELFDRAIALPFVDQEALAKDFLFGVYPSSKTDVNKYIKQPQPMQPGQVGPDGLPLQPQPGTVPGQPQPQGSPLAAAGRVSPLAAMGKSPLAAKF